jgi:hypothetical protein
MLAMAWRWEKLLGLESSTTGMEAHGARIVTVVVCDAKWSGALR